MANFDTAFTKIIGVEKGYANDPADKGGETKYGISKRSYPNEDIKNLTLDRAKVLYKRDFWDVLKLDQITNQTIAEEIFDTSVNCGVSFGAKTAQRAINLVSYPSGIIEVDGIVGTKTVSGINSAGPKLLYRALNLLQGERYLAIVEEDPSQRKFMKSWLSRVFEATV